MQTRTLVAAVVVLGMLAAGVFALRETLIPHEHAEADDGHGHAHAVGFSAGEPGNPRSPSRTIEVAMIERPDGRMAFEPSYIEVRRGEQVLFKTRNRGVVAHEMVVATLAENLAHAEEMKRNPDMEHIDPNSIRLVAGHEGEILWRFTRAGDFDFSCLISGHREAGMFGKIVVR